MNEHAILLGINGPENRTAPYGYWRSPITIESVVSKSRVLSSPRIGLRSGRAFYIETREAGGKTIVEISQDGLRDVLPAEYSASNSVYEYGGPAYEVLPDDRIIFSNKDNTVHILNPDNGKVSLLTKGAKLRYANFSTHPDSNWVLAVGEDHTDATHDTPTKVKNYIVAINTETAEVKKILDSADFYYTPQFSPDGKNLVWLEWNHPNLPFDAANLYSAAWQPDGSISDIHLISGDRRQGVAEPRWGPDGSLFFGQETKGYRCLFRILPGKTEAVEIKLDDLDNAEFGEICWFQGSHTYTPLSERYLAAAPVVNGAAKLILIDLQANSWKPLADSSILTEVMLDSMSRLTDSSFLVVGSGTTNFQTLYRFDVGESGKYEKLRESTEETLPECNISRPESIKLSSEGLPSRDIHGFLWMPHNPDFDPPEDELPPLIMLSHGGPTAYMGSGLKLRVQYFTSRGYACFALNYTGSAGHGRQYRDALWGNWGLIDSDDAAECANYLIKTGKVKADGIGITGASAGGYNTLQSLTRYPKTFAGGVCLSGISELKRLDESTHKLESDYNDHLVLRPDSKREDRDQICHDRSPLYHVDNIKSPLLLLHGGKDRIVPLEQAQLMADAIHKNGGDVEMIVALGEGHGFSQPKNVKLWLKEEERWWQKTLL
ncbi:Fc.00g020050.m01.CDS01 [Cosmosporella sp. VM-42]